MEGVGVNVVAEVPATKSLSILLQSSIGTYRERSWISKPAKSAHRLLLGIEDDRRS
jgi:hypothetical protein